MSTRSLTFVHSKWPDHDWRTHAVIYRHHDGYPDEHGQWLFKVLDGLSVVNGIRFEGMPAKWVNGPDRLASYLVYRLWEDGHNPGLHQYEVGFDCMQEYEYHIYVHFGVDGGQMHIEVKDCYGDNGHDLFKGSIANYGAWLDAYDPSAEDDE